MWRTIIALSLAGHAGVHTPKDSGASICGTYYSGDGLAVNNVLTLTRDHGFTWKYANDLMAHWSTKGTWSIQGQYLIIDPPVKMPPLLPIYKRFLLISWGKRMYLVPNLEMKTIHPFMVEFVNHEWDLSRTGLGGDVHLHYGFVRYDPNTRRVPLLVGSPELFRYH